MIPFLYRVAETFYSEYLNEVYRLTFVFPNKRAGVFFQKYLAEIAGNRFLPIITIRSCSSLSPSTGSPTGQRCW